MWKTLGCLAAAMSGTTVLLDWMAPVHDLSSRTMTSHQLVGLVRRAVSEGVVINSKRWVELEVASGPAGILQGRMLTATGSGEVWHFLVDRDGIPQRGRHWRLQKPVPDSPGTVRVLVEQSVTGHELTAEQWACIRALAAALSGATGNRTPSLPVRMDRSIAES